MTGQRPTVGHPGGSPRRRALAAAAVLIGSLILALSTAGSRQQRAQGDSHHASQSLAALATRVQATIARQDRRAAVRRWEVAHHEIGDPTDPPPRAQRPAIGRVDRVVRRWLSGYLRYEVDAGGARSRATLAATSTPAFMDELLAQQPLIPPTQRRPRPGHALELISTVAPSGRTARTYVEVAYGLQRAGLHLTLVNRGDAWLVVALAG